MRFNMDELERKFYRVKDEPSDDIIRAVDEAGICGYMEAVKNNMGGNGVVRCPVWVQFPMIGLNERYKGLKGKKVLDIGCGKEPDLVYWMRDHGIEAEGIDPRAPNEDYFMQQGIVVGGPDIPRPKNHYDAVIMSSVPLFNGVNSRDPNDCQHMLRLSELTHQVLRVLKPGCDFISAPRIYTNSTPVQQTLRMYRASSREEVMDDEDGLPIGFNRVVITKGN